MIIRKATPDDAAEITDILNEIIRIGGTTAYQSERTPEYFLPFIGSDDPKVFIHVAEADQKIHGCQYMEPFDPPDDHLGGIATFARPGGTQRGVGTELFRKTLAASRAAGYQDIVAVIRADNTGGLAYYTKMGFRDHCIHEAVPLTDGTPVDRVEKRLKL